jgi:hypothetical protein
MNSATPQRYSACRYRRRQRRILRSERRRTGNLKKTNAYQSGNDSCVSLTDWIGLRRFVDVVSLEYLRHVR